MVVLVQLLRWIRVELKLTFKLDRFGLGQVGLKLDPIQMWILVNTQAR